MTVCSDTELCWYGQRLKAAGVERALKRHIEHVCGTDTCFWCEGSGEFLVGETTTKPCWSCKGAGYFQRRR